MKACWAPRFRLSDWVGLGWGPRMCISNQCPAEADAAGQEPHLEKLP